MTVSYICRSTSSSTGDDLAGLPLLPEARSLLVDQSVAREVRGPQRERGVQVGRTIRQGRAGDAEDQVERPALDPRPNQVDGSSHFVGGVIPLQGREQIGLERLRSQADRFTPAPARISTFSSIERPGIRLDGPFAAGRQSETSGRSWPSAARVARGSSRVGVPPPTKIVSTWLRLLHHDRQLALERGEITVGQVVGARQRSEVAVPALVSAERNVNVGGRGQIQGG